MSPASTPLESRRLAYLSALFILLFFMLFTYSGLFAPFNFDDGTAVVADQEHFEIPMWRNYLHILTVFTTAYRPLATIFWRPLYAMFGFNPLPFRIAMHLMMVVNIGLAYLLARRLDATREASVLTALVFCYNVATGLLYYDTCTVTDVLCFMFYTLSAIVYLARRQSGEPFTLKSSAAVIVPYLLALDSKELAVTLPGVLSIYELIFHRRDFRDKQKMLRVGGLIAVLFVIGAIYLKVKVADMGQNAAYHPHVTLGFVAKNVSQYLRELLYLPENSVTVLKAGLIFAGIMAIGALAGSPRAVFGVLFFIVALIPVAVIPPRGAYCAYLPYFGLALAAGDILATGRRRVILQIRRKDLELRSAVALFLVAGLFLGWEHVVHWPLGIGYYEWTKPPLLGLLDGFQRTIPEFPPGARVLITEDPWGGDWGPMFLVRLMYHDKTVWVDRPNTMDRPPDLSTYDIVVQYKPPYVDLVPARLFGISMKWQVRGTSRDMGQFTVTSPNAHGAGGHIDFTPQAVRSAQVAEMKVPGLSNVAVNVLYRMVSGTKSAKYLVNNWCTLDANGTCAVTAPKTDALGAMVVDWIQPVNQRWIFTCGVLTIVR